MLLPYRQEVRKIDYKLEISLLKVT